jgi:hypothetical protein
MSSGGFNGLMSLFQNHISNRDKNANYRIDRRE